MPLRIPIRLALPHLEEAIRLTQGWSYWPRRLLVEKFGYTFLGFLFCGVSVMLFLPQRFATKEFAIGTLASAVVGFGFLTLTTARRRASLRRRLRKLDQESGTALIDDEGVVFESEDGAARTVLWGDFRRALVGRLCLVLFETKKDFRILPIAALTDDQRAELVSLLRVNLGPDKTLGC